MMNGSRLRHRPSMGTRKCPRPVGLLKFDAHRPPLCKINAKITLLGYFIARICLGDAKSVSTLTGVVAV
ncbi:hypothetical protein ACN38_g12246 [Penicillium nordicum]|uniref:Uncharacterized protein n=1 Tax=Penicillium nordicum TaxID=229535 RepID=A0A0M9WA08_9EURO|nr:hypothetical protein ACN38_g12246 [Penicillium nordicum]